jgi:hypothetical protein
MRTLYITLGLLVLLLGAIVGYAAYANHTAERAAEAFCAATPLGGDFASALERGEAQGARHRGPRTADGKEEHDFEFQGWVFNVGVCRVGVARGKVVSRRAMLEGD